MAVFRAAIINLNWNPIMCTEAETSELIYLRYLYRLCLQGIPILCMHAMLSTTIDHYMAMMKDI